MAEVRGTWTINIEGSQLYYYFKFKSRAARYDNVLDIRVRLWGLGRSIQILQDL